MYHSLCAWSSLNSPNDSSKIIIHGIVCSVLTPIIAMSGFYWQWGLLNTMWDISMSTFTANLSQYSPCAYVAYIDIPFVPIIPVLFFNNSYLWRLYILDLFHKVICMYSVTTCICSSFWDMISIRVSSHHHLLDMCRRFNWENFKKSHAKQNVGKITKWRKNVNGWKHAETAHDAKHVQKDVGNRVPDIEATTNGDKHSV